MEMFQKAAGVAGGGQAEKEGGNGREEEIARLKAQLAELQSQIDKLG